MTDLLRGMSIFLIGMMGTGKTTVGQLLAKEISYRFFDTDVLIERVLAKSISEIFAQEGEAIFRDVETQVLCQLCAETRSIVSTGGGVVLNPKNWSHLRHGLVIWLDAPVPVLVERLSADDTRPLLRSEDLTQKLTQLSQERRSLYSEADLHISIESLATPAQIVTDILEALPRALKTQINLSGENFGNN